MTAPLPPLLLVGCGRMGSALLGAWLEQGLEASVVVDPAPQRPVGIARAAVVADATGIPAGFSPAAVVFAIKPQHAGRVLGQYARFAHASLFLSIMAGRTIHAIASALGTPHAAGAATGAAIVRAMPNTPAAIRAGTTVACAGERVSDAQKELSGRLLAAVGRVAWVDDESLLDAVTAVSGSGPAYVFLLAELLERAAIEQGLPADLARLLARRTISGAGALLEASGEDAAALRTAVTSPGGTTERALSVLMDERAWPSAVSRAIAAATERSRELAR